MTTSSHALDHGWILYCCPQLYFIISPFFWVLDVFHWNDRSLVHAWNQIWLVVTAHYSRKMDLSIYTHDSETLVKKNIVACRRCSNYIFILDLTPGFNGWGKDDCKTRRKSFKFGDLVRLILEILRYVTQLWVLTLSPVTWCFLRVSSAILPPTYIDEQMIFSS